MKVLVPEPNDTGLISALVGGWCFVFIPADRYAIVIFTGDLIQIRFQRQ